MDHEHDQSVSVHYGVELRLQLDEAFNWTDDPSNMNVR